MRTLPNDFRQVSDLNEIIFANRNKAYGAYELRKHYNERLMKAFLLATSPLVLVLLLVTYVQLHSKPPQVNTPNLTTAADTLITVIIEPPKPEHPPVSSHSDLPPTRITQDSAVHETKKVDTSHVADSPGDHSPYKGDTVGQNGSHGRMGIIPDTAESKSKSAANIFTPIPEVYPSFPGGAKAFNKYVMKNFDSGNAHIEGNATEGKIILRFAVMKDGSITNVEVLKDNVGIDCVNSAKQMIMNSPKWNPGLQNNQPVNVMMVLPITIRKE